MSSVAGEVTCEVVVVGSGVAGLCTGIKLREAGFHDFVLLERAHEIGGTWRDQTYPGLEIDVPQPQFHFSFELNPRWSSMWAPQREMLDYLQHCTDKYGVREHVRFGQEVLDTSYDADRNVWVTRVADGTTYTSRYVINGSGYLSTIKWPEIEGIDRFEGTKLHTAQWSAAPDLEGKRVGLIGTGATSIQLAPAIAPKLKQLYVFQRTPIWLLPKPALRFPRWMKRAFATVPGFQRAVRLVTTAFMDLVLWRVFTKHRQVKYLVKLMEALCRRHIRQVEDPVVQEKLTPDYTWGCKRPSFSQDFYPMFNEPHVDLVTEPIERVTEHGIATADGREREIDVLICATGYQPFGYAGLPTYPVYGRGAVELREWWDKHRYQALKGIAVHGFPNYFLIFGPYSFASMSYFALVEISVRNVLNCLKAARRQGADYIEASAEAQRAEWEDMLRKKKHTIFLTGNCAASNTYYIDRHGDSPAFRVSNHPLEWWRSHRTSTKGFDIHRNGGVDLRTGKQLDAPASGDTWSVPTTSATGR